MYSAPVHSSLPLQKALYYNAYYAPVYVLANVAITAYKLGSLECSSVARIALPLCVIIFTVTEAVRLQLGYAGNLRERVPELSAFWLLTLFPALLPVLYLTFIQRAVGDNLMIDLAIGIPMVALLLAELTFALQAARTFIRVQTRAFYKLVTAGEAEMVEQNRAASPPTRIGSSSALQPPQGIVRAWDIARFGAQHILHQTIDPARAWGR